MKIEPRSIKVREVFENYTDNGDDGVFAYGGKLAIRPPYQREFVYDQKQAEAVIHTVLKGFRNCIIHFYFLPFLFKMSRYPQHGASPRLYRYRASDQTHSHMEKRSLFHAPSVIDGFIDTHKS